MSGPVGPDGRTPPEPGDERAARSEHGDAGSGHGEAGSGRPPGLEHGDLDDLSGQVGDASRRLAGTVAGATFVLLHALVGYLTLSLGLVAPPWAVALLLAVWAVVAVLGWRWRRRRPLLVMLAPFATASLAIAVVSFGDAYLGWQA